MLVYAGGTALCAFAPNLWVLGLFRLISALGIGGEWAAGAAMVAEVVPEKRRVEAGALLYTSAPVGLALASFTNSYIAGNLFADRPELSWRIVFLAGLLPAAVALLVRRFVREPERWVATARRRDGAPASPSSSTRRTAAARCCGFVMALVALLTWWSCNVFIPVVASGLAQAAAAARGLEREAMLALSEAWKSRAVDLLQLGRPPRHAADRAGGEVPRPPGRCSGSTSCSRRPRSSALSGSTCRRRRAWRSTSGSA